MNLQPHTGNACPVAADALVAVDLGDGELIVERAGQLNWAEGDPEADGAGRIHRYALLTFEGVHSTFDEHEALLDAVSAELEQHPANGTLADLMVSLARARRAFIVARDLALDLCMSLESFEFGETNDGDPIESRPLAH